MINVSNDAKIPYSVHRELGQVDGVLHDKRKENLQINLLNPSSNTSTKHLNTSCVMPVSEVQDLELHDCHYLIILVGRLTFTEPSTLTIA